MRYILVILAFGCSLISCKREQRSFRPDPSSVDVLNSVEVSGLHPGPGQGAPVVIPKSYQETAYAVSEGQRLYEQYNCVGCHAHGGGGMGPALMDDVWIYGSDPSNIFATIEQGRPNGMPSFGRRIPEYQIWELAAYVRSLSGLLPKDIAPNRTDEMDVKPAESSMPHQTPTGITGAPSQRQ